MKKNALLIILLFVFAISKAQKVVYNSACQKLTFEKEELQLNFFPSKLTFKYPKGKESGALFLSVLPTLVDVGFRLTEKHLENSVKKWSAEYSKQNSYLQAATRVVPNFQFLRTITPDGSTVAEEALSINFIADSVKGTDAFVYSISQIRLSKSAAKSSSRFHNFDYSIEIKVTYLKDGKKEVQELAPLVISSVPYGTTVFEPLKYRTAILPKMPGGVIAEIAVKILETNPAKVRAEKVLAFWNANKDDAKTIINNYLPKENTEDTVSDTETERGGQQE